MVRACAGYVRELCEATYGVAPSYRIEESSAASSLISSEGGIRIGGIGVHLEYILTELLKNAFRATVEFHTPKKSKSEIEEDEDIFTFDDLPSAHLSSEDFPEVVITIGVVDGVLSIRIRDRGGGIGSSFSLRFLLPSSPANLLFPSVVLSLSLSLSLSLYSNKLEPDNISSVFSYAFTTVPLLQDPDADPDSPYGGGGGGGGSDYYGGGGGGGESSLKTGLGTLAGLGFG